MLVLRDYQLSLIDCIRDQLRKGVHRILVQSPTGSGKTALSAHMIKGATEKGKRCWFTVHRRELVKQSIDTLEDSAGVHCGVIASGFGSNGYHLAQVASIQTLMRRWEKYALPELLIIDESHHSCSRSWTELINAIRAKNPKLAIIGLTATPHRLDGRGLGDHFDVIVQGPSVSDLIAQGYLSKFRIWAASLPDLTGVHTVAGDYNKSDLEAAMSRTAVVGDALAEYRKHCLGMRAIVFMWSVQSSKDLVDRFNSAGIPAAHVDGETDSRERDIAVAQFRAGQVKVLSNVELFGEGFDVPSAEAGFLMRPTRSLTLYLQQIGRLLRPTDGKEAALIFDHAGHCVKFGFPDDPRQWSLEGSSVSSDAKKRECPVRQCPKCYATVSLGTTWCRWCGTVFEVKPRKVEEQEGELQEMSDPQRLAMQAKREARREQGMASTYEALLKIEKRRGYKPGWAWYVWNSKKHRRLAGRDGSSPRGGQHTRLAILANDYRPKRTSGDGDA